MKKIFLMPLICLVFCYGAISYAVNSEDIKALMEAGIVGEVQDKTEDAIKAYDKDIQIAPQNKKAHYRRALAKGIVGDFRGQEEDINRMDQITTIHEIMSLGSNDERDNELTPNRLKWNSKKIKMENARIEQDSDGGRSNKYGIAFGERRSRFKLDQIISVAGSREIRALVTRSEYEYRVMRITADKRIKGLVPLKNDGTMAEKQDIRLVELDGKFVNRSVSSEFKSKAIITMKKGMTNGMDTSTFCKQVIEELNRKTLLLKMDDSKALKKSNLKIQKLVPFEKVKSYELAGRPDLGREERTDGWLDQKSGIFYEGDNIPRETGVFGINVAYVSTLEYVKK